MGRLLVSGRHDPPYRGRMSAAFVKHSRQQTPVACDVHWDTRSLWHYYLLHRQPLHKHTCVPCPCSALSSHESHNDCLTLVHWLLPVGCVTCRGGERVRMALWESFTPC